jgi:EAL domain-containing protein (putative c-di-GMP-specific phosphodiesterase class I)
VKIDRSFVEKIVTEEKDNMLVRALVDLAHALKMTVIAEGVETEEQSRILIDLGCDIIQGFLFSRPLATQDIDYLIFHTAPQSLSFISHASQEPNLLRLAA